MTDLKQPNKMVELDAFTIIGIAERTTNALEMTEQAKIPALWGRFYQEAVMEHIPGKKANVTYGCYSDYENGADGAYTITLGAKVALDSVPDGMNAVTLPQARYAVFTSRKGPITEIVPELWQAIWAWSETSELVRTFTGDFELYDERCANPEEAQVDIYIAVK
jgi:predicted transcriptional regulator YdeE